MKKVIVVLFILTLVMLFKEEGSPKVIIPEDAIRFRIIANSNSFEDQAQKLTIKTEIEPILADILNNSDSLTSTRELINNNIGKLETTIAKYNPDFTINYGNNYFPAKEYKGVTYKEGSYESLVITLGEGLGENWWCVLFPPLCLLEASADNIDDVNYSFYISEILAKF